MDDDNELGPSVSRGGVLMRWKAYDKVPDTTSATDELIQRCIEYRNLYMLRFAKKEITPQTALSYKFLADYFRAPSFCNMSLRNATAVMSRPKGYCNLLKFLQQLDEMELKIGDFRWMNYFISSPELTGKDANIAMMFSTSVCVVLKDLFEAVMRRDWVAVSEEISRIPIYNSMRASHEMNYSIYLSRAFSPYLSGIYLVALQTLLELGFSSKTTSRRYFYALEKFLLTLLHSCRRLDDSEFYVGHYLIYQLANLNYDMAESISEFSVVKLNNEWSRSFEVYKYCVEYEKFIDHLLKRKASRATLSCSNRSVYFKMDDCDEEEKSSFAQHRELSYFFSSVLATFMQSSASTSNAIDFIGLQSDDKLLNGGSVADCYGILPVFVHLAKVLNEVDVLEEAITGACLRNTLLLERAHTTLVEFGLDHIAGRIFTESLFLLPPEALSCHEFIVDIIEQRSLEPSKFGPFEDVISFNLRCMFQFLDFGRNRTYERAWGILYANLCYIEVKLTSFVAQYWTLRKAWWQRFHFAVQLHGSSRKLRKKTFAMLAKIPDMF